MTPQLYTKLHNQKARQTTELDGYQEIANLLITQIATFSIASASAKTNLDAVPSGTDNTAEQTAYNNAKTLEDNARSNLNEINSRISALEAAISKCQAEMDTSGLSLSPEDMVSQQLTEDRAFIWERIKAERDRRQSNGVLVAGKWFHSDSSSRIQQLSLVLMGASLPAGIMWKTMDTTKILMTPTLAGQIFQASATNDMNLFGVAEYHRANVDASQTPLLYDFHVGWPETFTK